MKIFRLMLVAVLISVCPSISLAKSSAKESGENPDWQRESKSLDDLTEKCLRLLKFGPDREFREPSKVDAVIVLGLIGDKRIEKDLLEHLQYSGERHLKQEIVKVLGWLKSKNAVPLLIKILDDPYDHLRGAAAHALGEIRDKRAIEPLKALLTDEYPHNRRFAAEALKKLTGKEFKFEKD